MHKEILVKPVKVQLKLFLTSVSEASDCSVPLALREGVELPCICRTGGGVESTGGRGASEERQIWYPCEKSKPDFSVVRPVNSLTTQTTLFQFLNARNYEYIT